MVERVTPSCFSAAAKPPFSTTALKILSKRKSYSATGFGIIDDFDNVLTTLNLGWLVCTIHRCRFDIQVKFK